MLIDKPQIVEGSSIINATIPSGTSFPDSPNVGELFYLTTIGQAGFYSYGGSGVWAAAANALDLANHLLDQTLHLTPAQNILLDAVSVTSADINSIPALQSQANANTSNLAAHIADPNVHLSVAQNTLLDGLTLPDLTAANVNFLIGATSNIQTQFGTLTTNVTKNTSDITALQQSTTSSNQTASTNLSNHIADDTRHLTASENTFIDGITIPFSDANTLAGLAAFLGAGYPLSSYLSVLTSSKLNINGTNAMTGSLNAGSFRIMNVASPTAASDAATKDYVDSFVQGLHWVGSTRVATTSNVSLLGVQIIDGIAPGAGERVLVKNQNNSSENGIWIIASGAWSRATDFNSTLEVNNSAVFVLAGSTQGKSTWIQTNTVNTLGVDPLSFTPFSGPVINSAGPGIALGTGGMVSVVQGEGIKFSNNAVAADIFSGGGLMTTLDGVTSSVDPASQLALAAIGTIGTYRSVTTDRTGRVVSGTNPTTLAGYGITDALANNTNGNLTGTLNVSSTVTAPSFVGNLTGTATSAGSSSYVTPISNGASSVKTGRNVWVAGLYTYNALSDPYAPNQYTSAVGFGNGSGGSAEIAVNWVGTGNGIFYRTLRDVMDNWSNWVRIIDTNNVGAYAPSFGGAGAYGTWAINISGTAAAASTVAWLNITGKPTQSSWVNTALEVSKYLGWKNYGDPHVIIDASAGTAPNGSAISSTNSQNAWTASYPTLMGWNGSQTYGARVDSARVSDSTAKASTLAQGGGAGTGMTFNYAGQGGQPTWLWGTNDGTNTYVWNPSNFSVNYAGTSGNTNSISSATGGSYTWTSQNYFRSNFNTAGGSYPPLNAFGDANQGAVMGFLRSGQYGLNMGLDNDNVFRIGGWSAAANRLQMDMSGNLTMAGDITAFSDRRIKKDIVTIQNAGAIVAAIRGVNFTRTDDDSRSTGVIAQEVQEVFPEAVMEAADGMLSVKYGNMVGLLVEAIKELQADVAALKVARPT